VNCKQKVFFIQCSQWVLYVHARRVLSIHTCMNFILRETRTTVREWACWIFFKEMKGKDNQIIQFNKIHKDDELSTQWVDTAIIPKNLSPFYFWHKNSRLFCLCNCGSFNSYVHEFYSTWNTYYSTWMGMLDLMCTCFISHS
jgi:hypothetical protein